MIIFDSRWQAVGRAGILPAMQRGLRRPMRYAARWATVAAAALGMGLLSGCASPGPARAPSLKLPEVASGLTASRVGDEVRLQWTTPARTTDKLLIAGSIEVEICRVTLGAAVGTSSTGAGQKTGAGTAAAARRDAGARPCAPVVLREAVVPGESAAVDRLPAELTEGAARLLAYRVQLRNAAGCTAGATAAVYAAAGAAPAAVEGLRARAAKAGVVLEWRRAAGDAVELNRVEAAAGAEKKPVETRLRVDAAKGSGGTGVGGTDAGGTIDRAALIGPVYRYSAQRVRTVEMDGQRVELRSVASAEVAVERKDVFAPEAPVGLVAVPGFADETADATLGQGSGKEATQASAIASVIDLSWEPDLEPRVVGYRVYRREWDGAASGAWLRLDAALVPVAAYHDRSVVAGRRYGYRVTAVDAVGNESAHSDEVVETALAR